MGTGSDIGGGCAVGRHGGRAFSRRADLPPVALPALFLGPVPLIAAGPGHVLAVDAAVVLVLVVAALAVALAGLIVRRRVLGRGGGTVDCAMRPRPHDASWRLGVGRYGGDELRWFRIFGVRLSADVVLSRRGLQIVARRPPDPEERAMLGADTVIVTCATGESVTDRTELAMSRSALTGFLSWLEGAPPGTHVSYAD